MSYLGSIGRIMENSGLSNMLETIYGENTVGHIFSGKAVSRALRGHFLTQSALMNNIIDTYCDNVELVQQMHLIYEEVRSITKLVWLPT